MHYLALCCIIKDEQPYLKEWLALHALLGVEHFYLYDNQSRIPVREVLAGFCTPDQVTIREIAGQGVQMEAYLDCLRKDGSACHWLGFIDIDEFICPLQDNDLRLLLPEYEAYAALVLSWDMFGSNGHLHRPDGLVIDNYTTHFPPHNQESNLHVKSIVKPAQTLAVRSPHFFHYQAGALSVNTQHFPVVNSAFSWRCHELVKLNHYYYRSQQDFEHKVGRGNAHRNNFKRSLDTFYQQAQEPVQAETALTRFAPAVRQILAVDRLPQAQIYVQAQTSLPEAVNLALSLIEQRRTEQAAICLAQISQYHPHCQEVWTLLAALARFREHPERAGHLLRHGASFGLDPALLAEYGRLQARLGHTEQNHDLDFCACFLESRLTKQIVI